MVFMMDYWIHIFMKPFLGICMLVYSIFAVCMVFYYLFAPVRRQTIWWFIYALINGVVNLGISLYYTVTPLINNEIEPDAAWSELDCIGFGITNILWSFVFFVVFSLIVKRWSTAKYVPFQKF